MTNLGSGLRGLGSGLFAPEGEGGAPGGGEGVRVGGGGGGGTSPTTSSTSLRNRTFRLRHGLFQGISSMSPEEEVVPSRDPSGGGELPHGLFQGIAPMPSEEEGDTSRDPPSRGELRRGDGEWDSREEGDPFLDPPGELRRGDGECNTREC